MNVELFEDTLSRALRVADEEHGDAHPYKRAAFANAVTYVLTGLAGGYGGPSVREHVACQCVPRLNSFKEACERVSPWVFGPLTDAHRVVWKSEYCFQDDPADVEELS